MEFFAHALPHLDAKTRTLRVDDPTIHRSGLRLCFAYGGQLSVFPGAGTLIVSTRSAVRLRIGEQYLQLPRFSAYFIPSNPAARKTGAAAASVKTNGDVSSVEADSEAGIVQVQSTAPLLVMCASDVTWKVLGEQMGRLTGAASQPIAGQWPDARALVQWLLRSIRHARQSDGRGTLESFEIYALAKAMQAGLAGLAEHIDRCPGRWRSQKLSVYRRLAKVQQFIDLHCTDKLSVKTLANMANYSRSHFMSVYRDVFQSTPHAQQVELRLRYAQRVLVEQGMSVHEATLASGFEDRTSFSKLFHRRFGMTALQARNSQVAKR